MRIVLLLTVLLLIVGAVIASAEDIVVVPNWVQTRQAVGYQGYSSEEMYDGHAELMYRLKNWYLEINGSSVTIYGILQATGYEGVVSYTPNFPFVYAKFRVYGTEYWNLKVQYVNGTYDAQVVQPVGFVTYSHRVITLYHKSSDILYAVLEVMFQGTEANFYVVTLKWFRQTINHETGNVTTVEVSSVSATGSIDKFQPLVVEVWVRPNFYSLTVIDNTTNETYLVYGFKGYIKAYCQEGCAIDTGTFEFAWQSKRLGPRENVTESMVADFLDDLRGWYIWVGAGLDYYVPEGSVIETLPHTDDNKTWLSLGTYYFLDNISQVIYFEYNYTFYIDIIKVYFENWVTNPSVLYAMFVSGNLEAYLGVYFNINDNTVSTFKYFVNAVLPVVLAIMLLGAMWRIRWAAPAFFILTLAVGAGFSIYKIPELVGGLLALVASYYLQHDVESNVVQGENSVSA